MHSACDCTHRELLNDGVAAHDLCRRLLAARLVCSHDLPQVLAALLPLARAGLQVTQPRLLLQHHLGLGRALAARVANDQVSAMVLWICMCSVLHMEPCIMNPMKTDKLMTCRLAQCQS